MDEQVKVEEQKYCTEAILSIWLAVASVVFFLFMPLPLLLSVAAVIAGILALIKVKKNPELKGKFHAMMGIAIGCIEILIYLYGIITFFSGSIPMWG